MPDLVNYEKLSITCFDASPRSIENVFKNIPILNYEQERELLEQLHVQGDLSAAHKLVYHNARYVAHVTVKYDGYGFPFNDIFQNGIIGLMKAIKNFDLKQTVRLFSYATHYIESEIKEYIVNNWGIVKITSSKKNKKLFFNIRKYMKNNDGMSNDELEIAHNELGIDKETITDFITRLPHDVSIHAPKHTNEDGGDVFYEDILTDGVTLEDQIIMDERREMASRAYEAMSTFTEREQDILMCRFGETQDTYT